jgi:hypothetical protein
MALISFGEMQEARLLREGYGRCLEEMKKVYKEMFLEESVSTESVEADQDAAYMPVIVVGQDVELVGETVLL